MDRWYCLSKDVQEKLVRQSSYLEGGSWVPSGRGRGLSIIVSDCKKAVRNFISSRLGQRWPSSAPLLVFVGLWPFPVQ